MEDRPDHQATDRDQHRPITVPAPALEAWTLTGDRVALCVNTRLYALPAIRRAAYTLTDRAYVFLAPAEEAERVLVVLATNDATSVPESLVGEFMNALLDHQVREDLHGQYGAIHDLVVAEALSTTSLLHPEDE